MFVSVCSYVFFFFQAEDGIRDDLVTGVQTCALPICTASPGTTDRERYVVPGEAVLLEPVVVQHGGAGMHHRPSHDACEEEAVGGCHRRIFSCNAASDRLKPCSRPS